MNWKLSSSFYKIKKVVNMYLMPHVLHLFIYIWLKLFFLGAVEVLPVTKHLAFDGFVMMSDDSDENLVCKISFLNFSTFNSGQRLSTAQL